MWVRRHHTCVVKVPFSFDEFLFFFGALGYSGSGRRSHNGRLHLISWSDRWGKSTKALCDDCTTSHAFRDAGMWSPRQAFGDQHGPLEHLLTVIPDESSSSVNQQGDVITTWRSQNRVITQDILGLKLRWGGWLLCHETLVLGLHQPDPFVPPQFLKNNSPHVCTKLRVDAFQVFESVRVTVHRMISEDST